MRRVIPASWLLLLALSAPVTGVFIGDRTRTLHVGPDGYCLAYPKPVVGAVVNPPTFALRIERNQVCTTPLETTRADLRVWLEGRDDPLTYALQADPYAPETAVRVLLPEPEVATKAPRAQKAPKAKVVLPLPQFVEGGEAPTSPRAASSPKQQAEPEPTDDSAAPQAAEAPAKGTERELASLLEALDDVLVRVREGAGSDPKPKQMPANPPKPMSNPTPGAAPKAAKNPPPQPQLQSTPKTEARPAQSQNFNAPTIVLTKGQGYTPVAPADEANLFFRANLFPGAKTYTITYTLSNQGRYPLITDPKRFQVYYNGQPLEARLTQRSTAGFAGWVPPGFEEAGSLKFAAPKGDGALELRVSLLRLNPTRDEVAIRRVWRLKTVPVVLPGE